jgi:hypothetical protein
LDLSAEGASADLEARSGGNAQELVEQSTRVHHPILTANLQYAESGDALRNKAGKYAAFAEPGSRAISEAVEGVLPTAGANVRFPGGTFRQ